MEDRTLKISCEGSAVVDHTRIKPLQRDLKSLSKENFEKLKNVLLSDGFTNPINVWKENEENLWTIDGHQRIRVIKTLAEQGFTIPPLPVNWIIAKDKPSALRVLLSHASTYGDIDKDGLYEFMNTEDFLMEDLKDIRFVEVDFPKFDAEYFDKSGATDPEKEWEGMPEFDQQDKTAYQIIQLHLFDKKAAVEFSALIKQPITDKTKTVWIPAQPIGIYKDKTYESKS